jgi:hypothetical protein
MYQKNSSSRKSNVASKTNKAESNQNTYSDFSGNTTNVQESNYPGNKVKKGSYKPESTSTSSLNPYKDF